MYFEMGSFASVASTVATIGEGCGSTCPRDQEERTIAVEINPKSLSIVAMLPSVEFMLIKIKMSREAHRHIWLEVVQANARAGHPNVAQIAAFHRCRATRLFVLVCFRASARGNESVPRRLPTI